MFLPNEYEVPTSSGASSYMKFQEGANKFRILGPAITGYEYWTTENKPVRSPKPFPSTPDIKTNPDGSPQSIKHFWAFPVWNYQESAVQVLEITQATIQRGLKIKIDNREGNATGNDFIVTKTGKGMETEYDVDVSDPKPLSDEIAKAFMAKPINLQALFTGGDPFAKEGGNQSNTATESINVDDIHF